MVSLTRNLMIRRRMLPRNEGLRLHFIVNQAAGLFSALAASSNNRMHSDSKKRRSFLALLFAAGDAKR